MVTLFCRDITPNWEGLYSCMAREGTPDRVYFMELFLDKEVGDAICERYGVLDGLDPSDPWFKHRAQIALQRFLGYDTVVADLDMPSIITSLKTATAEDFGDLRRANGRVFVDEHTGPITTWDDFDRFPWPKIEDATTQTIEWYQENLPDDMCIIPGLLSHFLEYLTWLMGYETLCIALCEQRDLVAALSNHLIEFFEAIAKRVLQFDRVKLVWGSDDMGFRGGTLISPDDMREFVLPGHKRIAELAHEAGCLYMLHSCGDLSDIMDDLINDVHIDVKHSFEDTIESVVDAKKTYGDRIGFLGGIDVDFLCRADEAAVRKRVRETLEQCHPGGGYCLGTGNSVANYIPLDNYLVMLDEGRRFAG